MLVPTQTSVAQNHSKYSKTLPLTVAAIRENAPTGRLLVVAGTQPIIFTRNTPSYTKLTTTRAKLEGIHQNLVNNEQSHSQNAVDFIECLKGERESDSQPGGCHLGVGGEHKCVF